MLTRITQQRNMASMINLLTLNAICPNLIDLNERRRLLDPKRCLLSE
jgi:hypothetical protein